MIRSLILQRRCGRGQKIRFLALPNLSLARNRANRVFRPLSIYLSLFSIIFAKNAIDNPKMTVVFPPGPWKTGLAEVSYSAKNGIDGDFSRFSQTFYELPDRPGK
jgi:hypothetical protein